MRLQSPASIRTRVSPKAALGSNVVGTFEPCENITAEARPVFTEFTRTIGSGWQAGAWTSRDSLPGHHEFQIRVAPEKEPRLPFSNFTFPVTARLPDIQGQTR